jgi:hypothetical protein
MTRTSSQSSPSSSRSATRFFRRVVAVSVVVWLALFRFCRSTRNLFKNEIIRIIRRERKKKTYSSAAAS